MHEERVVVTAFLSPSYLPCPACSLQEGGKVSMWVPLQAPASSYGITAAEDVPTGEVLVELTYKVRGSRAEGEVRACGQGYRML